MIDNTATATPAEIDREIVRIQGNIARVNVDIEFVHRHLRRGQEWMDRAEDGQDIGMAREWIAEDEEKLMKLQELIEGHTEDLAPLHRAYREHGWTRFYLVTNGTGHVHSSTYCSTCYSTTRFSWLTILSGSNEAEAIEEWGERICSECFPNAPVHPRFSEPSRQDLAARAERQAEKDVKTALAVEKSLVTFVKYDHRTIKSLVAAQRQISMCYVDLLHYGNDHPSAPRWLAGVAALLEAVSEKTGETSKEIADDKWTKAVKTYRRKMRGYMSQAEIDDQVENVTTSRRTV